MPLSFPANDTTALPSTLHSYQRTYGHQGSSSSSRHAFTPSKPWFSLDIDSLATDDESVPDHNDESDHCDKDVKSTDYYSGEDSQDWPNQMSPGSPIGEGVQHEELPTPSPPQQHHYHQQDLRNSLPSSAVVSKVELPERSGRQKSMSPLLPSASFEQKGRSIASSGSNSPAKTKTPSKSVVATAKTGSLKHILPHQKPFSLSRQPNPTLPLEVQRYQATQRLAAAWQAICDKYERQVAEAHAAGHEFLDDEIDLETCEIVVDHGVVRSQKKAPFGSLTATMLQSTADTTEDSANDMHDNHHCTQSKHNKEDVELQKQRRKRARQQRQLRLARAQESESAHNHVGSASGDGDEEEEDIEGEDEEQERHFGRSAGNQRISYSSVRRTSNFLPPTDSIDGDGDEEDNLAHDTEECSENDDNVQEVGEDDEEEKEDHEANSSFDNLLDSPRPPVQFARFTDDDFDSLLSSPNAYSKRQIWRAEQPLRRLIAEEYIYERQARRHRGHAEELSEIEDQDGQDEDEEEDEEEDDDDGDGTESDGAYDGDGEYHQRRPQLSDYEQDGIASFGEEDGDDVDEHEDDIRADGDEAWDAVSHHSYDHYDTEDNGIPTLADTRPADQPGISVGAFQTIPTLASMTPRRRLLWSRPRTRSRSPSSSPSSVSPTPSPIMSSLDRTKYSLSEARPPSHPQQLLRHPVPENDDLEHTTIIKAKPLPATLIEEHQMRRRTTLSPKHRAEKMWRSSPTSSPSPTNISTVRTSTSRLAFSLLSRDACSNTPPLMSTQSPLRLAHSLVDDLHYSSSSSSSHVYRRSDKSDADADADTSGAADVQSGRKRSYATAIEMDEVDPYDDESWNRWHPLLNKARRGYNGLDNPHDTDRGSNSSGTNSSNVIIQQSSMGEKRIEEKSEERSGVTTIGGSSDSHSSNSLGTPSQPPPEPPVWKKPEGWQKPKVVAAIEQDEVDPYDDESWTRWQASQTVISRQ